MSATETPTAPATDATDKPADDKPKGGKGKGGSKPKPKAKVEAGTLDKRIAQFFRTLPYGEAADFGELTLDLNEKEQGEYVSKEEAESILKRKETDGFKQPEKATERLAAGRAYAVEAAVGRLVRAGILTPEKISEPGKPDRTGYAYTGKDEDEKIQGELTRVPADKILVDEKIQMRAGGTNQSVVAKYHAVANKLPPLRVWDTGAEKYLLSRGFHRFPAMVNAGMDMVPVEVCKGTVEDAKLDAIADNAEHGFARTGEDIKVAVGAFLSLPGRRNSSTSAVANAVRCAWATADRYAKYWRKQWAPANKPSKGTPATPEKKPDTTEPVPQVAEPTGAAPTGAAPAEGSPELAKVTDKLGNPIADEAVARAFTDTRLSEAVGSAIRMIDYIRDIHPDGYSLCAIPVKGREETLNEAAYNLTLIRDALPYAVCPADAKTANKELAAAVRRGWLSHKEWLDYVKAKEGDKAKNPDATATPPAADNLAPATDAPTAA